MFVVHGTLATRCTLAELESLLVKEGVPVEERESSHFVGGRYLRIHEPGVHMTLERVSEREYLCRADAEVQASLSSACLRLAGKLAALGVGYRLELYDEADALMETFLNEA
jgi:hypothetical protein